MFHINMEIKRTHFDGREESFLKRIKAEIILTIAPLDLQKDVPWYPHLLINRVSRVHFQLSDCMSTRFACELCNFMLRYVLAHF